MFKKISFLIISLFFLFSSVSYSAWYDPRTWFNGEEQEERFEDIPSDPTFTVDDDGVPSPDYSPPVNITNPQPDVVINSGANINNNTNQIITNNNQNNDTGLVACDGTNCGFIHLLETIKNILALLTKFGFLIVTVAILWAGVLYLMAAGSPNKTTEAKKVLTNSLIGLFFIVAAYGIVWFMVDMLLKDEIKNNPIIQGIKP